MHACLSCSVLLFGVCSQYALPLVVIDGRSLADLAHGVMDGGIAPHMQDLLVCIHVSSGAGRGGGKGGSTSRQHGVPTRGGHCGRIERRLH
jgi:hypothetical protein